MRIYSLILTSMLMTLLIVAGGCAHAQHDSVSNTPSAAMQTSAQTTTFRFVDLDRFDKDLSQSLMANQGQDVQIRFFERVSPNTLPPRLQKWLNGVEAHGGQIRIELPPDELAPKNPMALLGVIGHAFSASELLDKLKEDRMLTSAKGRDAVLVLQRGEAGGYFVESLRFASRGRP